jgi:integrase
VRIVYNWGERHELIRVNKWHLFIYKVAKEKRTKPRAEYRSDEFLKIWKALDPTKRGQWRAWVAVGLLGIYGNRQTEILNLQWPWITGDAVRIDPSVVKTGEESILTLFPLTRAILKVAREWAAREGYSGDYVLFAGQYAGRRHQNKKPHYSIQSLTDAIHLAEGRAAGVEQVKWRAGHGFRRGLVGDLADETGDVMLALQAVGDRDISMAPRYRLRRNDKVDRAVQDRAARLMPSPVKDGTGATKVQPNSENDNSPADGSTGESDANSNQSTTYSDT